jgi:hypothetical protein
MELCFKRKIRFQKIGLGSRKTVFAALKLKKAYRVGYSGPVCFDVNLRPTCKTGGDNRTARNINE